MKRVVVVLLALGCGSKEAAKHPDDHEIHRTETAERTEIYGKGVDLAKLPPSDAMPLPVAGTGDIDIDIKTPMKGAARDYSHANGHIAFHCEACRIGDDKTKLRPATKNARASALVGDGLLFGHIDFERIDIAVSITDGKVAVKDFTVASKDVDIKLTATAELAPAIADSRVDACLRFKATPALAARDPRTDAVIQTTGAPMATDGYFNIRLTDRLSSLKRLGVVCDGTAQPEPPTRPQLTADDSSAPLDPKPATDTATPVTPAPAPDPALDAAIAKGITKKSETSFEVSQGVVDKIMANPMAISNGARVVPAVANGVADGFKLYAIKQGSFFERAGFMNGDTIHTVAGISVTTADHALDAYAKVRDTKPGETIEVEITRRGKPLNLQYKLR